MGPKVPPFSRGWAQAESVAREEALGRCLHSIVTAISWRAWWGFRDPESTRGGERSCRRGEPGGAGHGVTSFGGSDTASGACSSDGWHRLVARLLQLQLRFLITSVLRDRSRVIPWGFCRGKKTRFNIIHNHCYHLGEHSQRTSHTHCTVVNPVAHVSGVVLWRACMGRPSSTSGGYPTNGDTTRPPEAAATTVASPDTAYSRSTVTPPGAPILIRPLPELTGLTPVRVQ